MPAYRDQLLQPYRVIPQQRNPSFRHMTLGFENHGHTLYISTVMSAVHCLTRPRNEAFRWRFSLKRRASIKRVFCRHAPGDSIYHRRGAIGKLNR